MSSFLAHELTSSTIKECTPLVNQIIKVSLHIRYSTSTVPHVWSPLVHDLSRRAFEKKTRS